MLPRGLKARAEKRAKETGLSLGEFIRQAVRRALEKAGAPSYDPFINDRAVFRGDVPRDLARNHDRYLYGERS